MYNFSTPVQHIVLSSAKVQGRMRVGMHAMTICNSYPFRLTIFSGFTNCLGYRLQYVCRICREAYLCYN